MKNEIEQLKAQREEIDKRIKAKELELLPELKELVTQKFDELQKLITKIRDYDTNYKAPFNPKAIKKVRAKRIDFLIREYLIEHPAASDVAIKQAFPSCHPEKLTRILARIADKVDGNE